MDYEKIARANHRGGMSCSGAVYRAFSDINRQMSNAPAARSEGGKCGAVLSAEKVLRETGTGKIDVFEGEFIKQFGSVRCSDLRGLKRGKCNDFVGLSAAIAEKLMA